MDKNLILRSGKYAGNTIEWLYRNDLNYLNWITENRPNMLKERKAPEPKKEVKFRDAPVPSMTPNMEFDSEGPDEHSKEYLKKMSE